MLEMTRENWWVIRLKLLQSSLLLRITVLADIFHLYDKWPFIMATNFATHKHNLIVLNIRKQYPNRQQIYQNNSNKHVIEI